MKILAIAPLLLIAACSKSPEAAAVENNADLLADNMEAQADAMDVAESSGPTDNWATDESVDAINDNRVITGKTQVNGETNDIQIELSCLPDASQLIYKINSFDKDSDGARIRPSFTSFGMMNGLIFRADAKPAQQASTLNPQYNNQTTITGDSAFQAASAKTLTLRIQYDNANETYFLNQDSDNFRRAIKPCFISRRAALDAQQAREAMANPTPEPTSTPTDTATPQDQPNKYRTAPLIEPSTAQPTGT